MVDCMAPQAGPMGDRSSGGSTRQGQAQPASRRSTLRFFQNSNLNQACCYSTRGMTPLPVGNYKGVMLCNRPDDTGAASGGPHGSRPMDAHGAVFMPPGQPAERLGLNPARDNLVTNVQARGAELIQMRGSRKLAERNGNFMFRHRKWLSQLGATKRDAEVKATDDSERAAVLRAKLAKSAVAFRNRLQERREAATATHAPKGSAVRSAPAQDTTDTEDADTGPAVKEVAFTLPAAAAKPAAAAGRPKWALTEAVAVASEHHEEDEEVSTLLDFAQNLDFEKYVNNFEVRAALETINGALDAKGAAPKMGVEGGADFADEVFILPTLHADNT
ncbi:hypothetical protein T492DRAFT_503305 [Pavlovales sp. CCMP2436]|nr:hypothetical protein T492DRAFT_503305 [Pavlovales sp. CCMP2436]